jgi:exosortase
MLKSQPLRPWLIALLACIVAGVCWPGTEYIGAKWRDTSGTTYVHGWLILAVCIWLVLRSRRELAAAPARVSPIALLALAGAMVAWLLCYRASIESLEVAVQPLIFWLAVTGAFGWSVGRLLLFPVGYLYFAVPIWDPVPLQHLTLLAVRGMLALTGPAALITGDEVHLVNGTFLIEEGCSGLHFMIVGLAVAALYGELERDPWRTRVKQLALMAALALIANWVRVYTVIEAGYLTDMRSYLVRVSHYGFGWGVFAVALCIFFWLVPRFAAGAGAEARPAPAPPRAASVRPELAGLAVAVAIIVALPLLSARVRSTESAPDPAPQSITARAPWQAVPLDVRSAWQPMFAGADRLQRYAFGNAQGETVEVVEVLYGTQRQGAELVGETSSLFGPALAAGDEQVVMSARGAFREAEVIERSGLRSLVWWRFEVAGRNLTGQFTEQLLYGAYALVSNPPAGLIALRVACRADCDSARRTLRDFVATSVANQP